VPSPRIALQEGPDARGWGVGVFAERVLLQQLQEPKGPRKQRAVGVLACDYVNLDGGRGGTKWRILVRAPLVVASAGSIHSPALLLRSGITVNDNVGRNLRLHPGTIIGGIFPEARHQLGWGEGALEKERYVSVRGWVRGKSLAKGGESWDIESLAGVP
jgi:GMC oxidoreductase